MITIAVVNTKGGVGKTTISALLAVEAAKESGRVAMVDLDPQKSLAEWWKRRGSTDNPTIEQGNYAQEAVEALAAKGFDWAFLDSPPAFIETVRDCVECADLAVIPLKPSMLDLVATQDAVMLAREASTPFLCVLNDVGPKERESVEKSSRNMLFTYTIPIADTTLIHRVPHVTGMTVGKSASEVNQGRDRKAVAEITSLWQEVKATAIKAANIRAPRERVASNG